MKAVTVEPARTGTPVQDASVPVQLADGTAVILRPVAHSDNEYFRLGFLSMSPEARYHRFFAYSPGLSDAQLRYFTEVNQLNHVAWVAVTAKPTPAPGLGVARFVRMPEQPEIAEISLAVIDVMQGKGLGLILLAMVYLLAAEKGVEVLRAVCLAENSRMVNWLCRLGAKSRGYFRETIELDLQVREGPVVSGPSGGTSERFASTLRHLGRALTEAREKLHSPGALSSDTCTINHLSTGLPADWASGGLERSAPKHEATP